MATRSLNVVITGDAKQLGVATKQATKHLDTVESKSKRVGRAVSVAFGGAAVAGIAGVTVGLKKSADAAIEAEKSTTKLQAQLKALGFSYRAHAKEIDNVIQKQSKLSGLDDEDLADSFTNIVRITKNVNEALKLNGLAADIARAKNIDVAKAGQLVGKAYDGNVGALKRYGVSVTPVTAAVDKLKESHKKATDEQMRAAKAADKQATAQGALAAAQRTFSGQAAAYGKTTAGSLDRSSVAFENLGEVIGAKVTPLIAKGALALTDLIDKSGGLAGPIRTASGTIVNAFNRAKEAINKFVADNREDINTVIQAVKNLGTAIKAVIEHVIIPAVKILAPFIKTALEGIVQTIRGIIQVVSGVLTGQWGKAWDGLKNIVKGRLKTMVALVEGVATLLFEAAKAAGLGLAKGIIAGLGQLGHLLLQKVKEAVGWVTSKVGSIGSGIGKALNPFGDGIGKPSGGSLPAGGAFGGSMKGAQSALKPFAAAGSRFGLSVTSGRRPGSITSSGNVSYHSSGEAIDMGDGRGPDANKLNFFKYMKSRFGGRLAELIYTPGGQGIKNGQPFTYGGQVAADHYDHVHVALDTGAPGVGDGIGQIKSLWTRAGGSSSAQNMAAAISMAESGGNPNASHKNADGSIDRGLWQINSVHGALSTFDRLGNAKAAVSISGNGRNWNPWTVFKTGAYKRFLSAAGKAPSTKGGSPGKPPGKSVPTIGGSGIPSKPPTYDQIDTALGLAVEEAGGQDNPAALNALVNQRAALSDRATKIRAALRKKGLRPETRARLQAELAGLVSTARQMDAQISSLRNPPAAETDSGGGAGTGEDPNQPLIDATNELARIEQQRIDLDTQVQANQAKIIALANQGPEILAAVIAAVNGGIGGQVGLGLQTPGYAGAVANYGGSAGRL